MTTPSPTLLQSKEHGDILNTIDALRSLGISHYVDLPQVIVCGDQSSGKSSVLEAVSGIQFPRKDNLCTRFAIEVVLRRGSGDQIDVSIVPGSDRTEDEKNCFVEFSRSGVDLSDIASIIDDARSAVGIDTQSKNFSNDILRFEITGPTQPQLTLVDLPGLFQASNKSQSDEDSKAVTALVRWYMNKSRSIILAVVSAKNDFANQIVTKYARELDPHGSRTLGVITKPDTLHTGSESEKSFLELAENKDVHLHHGWHVLRNRDYDTRFTSSKERDEAEEEFFSNGIWTRLPRDQVGIVSLRSRLSLLLRDQILTELPGLVEDIEAGLENSRSILAKLGSSRASLQDQRLYLLRASQTFSSLAKSAIDGSYNDRFFESVTTDSGRRKRLRAVVQNLLMAFSRRMREYGHAKHILENVSMKQRKENPRLISRSMFIDEVLTLMERSRGRELPGTYNPQIVGDLFHAQSQPWEKLVRDCVLQVWEATTSALDLILRYAVDEKTVQGIKQHIISPELGKVKQAVLEQTLVVLKPHQLDHPITYNHYLTDNIQKLRQSQQRKFLTRTLDTFFGTDIDSGITICERKTFDVRSLLSSLIQNTEVDMDRYACSEAIDCMKAYYKVAMKTFVDDFSMLVVEDTLLQRLPGLFSPERVVSLGDALIGDIAAETKESQEERARTTAKTKSLENALALLRSMAAPTMKTGDDSDSFQSSDEEDARPDSQPDNMNTPDGVGVDEGPQPTKSVDFGVKSSFFSAGVSNLEPSECENATENGLSEWSATWGMFGSSAVEPELGEVPRRKSTKRRGRRGGL